MFCFIVFHYVLYMYNMCYAIHKSYLYHQRICSTSVVKRVVLPSNQHDTSYKPQNKHKSIGTFRGGGKGAGGA
jgi:hypothetical protein